MIDFSIERLLKRIANAIEWVAVWLMFGVVLRVIQMVLGR